MMTLLTKNELQTPKSSIIWESSCTLEHLTSSALDRRRLCAYKASSICFKIILCFKHDRCLETFIKYKKITISNLRPIPFWYWQHNRIPRASPSQLMADIPLSWILCLNGILHGNMHYVSSQTLFWGIVK